MTGEPNTAFKVELKSLLDRLQSLPCGETEIPVKTWRENTGRTLWRWCKSIAHAKAVAEHLATSAHFRPAPSEIRDAAESMDDPAEIQRVNRPAAGCAVCGGSGWQIVRVTVVTGIFAGEERDEARRCPCTKASAA